jgi:alkanesulfonate monooxygenase SsuD/methylene tetrahydromethanopterin reductase-like flavin-dependent oxidoreductase (luciferase family)
VLKPARPIPICLGGSSEPAYNRAARLADGFIFIGGDIDHTIDAWKRLRDRVRSLGRSVEEYVMRPQGDLTRAPRLQFGAKWGDGRRPD